MDDIDIFIRDRYERITPGNVPDGNMFRYASLTACMMICRGPAAGSQRRTWNGGCIS
jgi:hypothetical protein